MVQCNDKVQKQHLHTTGRNATYISPMSQNAVIGAISTVMQTSIIDEVKETRFFSLLADETTDFQGRSKGLFASDTSPLIVVFKNASYALIWHQI